MMGASGEQAFPYISRWEMGDDQDAAPFPLPPPPDRSWDKIGCVGCRQHAGVAGPLSSRTSADGAIARPVA